MKKLNELVKSNNVKGYGFKAIVNYCEINADKNGEEIVVSTLSPALMAEIGIKEYYAPVLPRNSVFNTSEDVEQADLEVNHVVVCKTMSIGDKRLIVSRHPGTIGLLKDTFPDAEILTGNVTKEDIEGCYVVGTLPPHLIQHVQAYSAFVIKDFDYAKDGDLSGNELEERGKLCDPIKVVIE